MVSRIWKYGIYIWYENVKGIWGVGLLKRVLVFEEKKREGGQRYTSRHLKKFFSGKLSQYKSVTLGY
jgi:hypothetical protein